VCDAQHERAPHARGHDRLRFARGDDDQAERAAQFVDRQPHGLGQIALVKTRDQMRDDFGVGLRAELDPFGVEQLAQRLVVLDDAVVDDGDLAAGVQVRVRVELRDAAVSRPARVRDADRPALRRRRPVALQPGDHADALANVERPILDQRNPGRIVAAIFEALQAVDQETARRFDADATDDAAHRLKNSSEAE